MPYSRPRDTDRTINGYYYKIGAHNHPYWWNGEEWIKSNRPISHVTTGDTRDPMQIRPGRKTETANRSIQ